MGGVDVEIQDRLTREAAEGRMNPEEYRHYVRAGKIDRIILNKLPERFSSPAPTVVRAYASELTRLSADVGNLARRLEAQLTRADLWTLEETRIALYNLSETLKAGLK